MEKDNKNKYGLTRTIASETKRNIRKECGFGCIVCGSAIYQYEHILPEFHEAKSHDIDKIGLLCGTCHDKVTRRIFPKEFIQEQRLKPFCLNVHPSKYEYYIKPNSDVVIELGKIKFINTTNVIVIDGIQVLSIHSPEEENSPPIIYAQFFDREENKVAWINHNEWHGCSESFDIEAVGSKIKIRSNLYKVDLDINLLYPNIFQIDSLNLSYNSKTIKGNRNKGYKIETSKSSLLTGGEEITFRDNPFGISIQGDKVYVGSSKIVNYENLKGEKYQLDGHYEVSGKSIKLEYGDSGSPKISFKKSEEDRLVGIKFNLPESELPKIVLRFKKQNRNFACNCGSALTYKICCYKNELHLNSLVNQPSYIRITQNVFSIHKMDNIIYRFDYSSNSKSVWLEWSEYSPIIVLNSSKSFTLNDISYSLLFWNLKKAGYNFVYDVYSEMKEHIITDLQNLIISIPIIEAMKLEGLRVIRFFENEVTFIKSTMLAKVADENDFKVGGTSIFEAIKILRLQYNTEYLKDDERESILNLFRKKSPVAFDISIKLNSIIKENNLFEKAGYNGCVNSCFKLLNELSKGAFNKIV